MRQRQPAPLSYRERDKKELAAQADQPESLNFHPRYRVLATALGPWPGQDFLDAQNRVRGQLGSPHLSFLPELADRGFATSTLARTIASLDGLTADGTSFGWRIREGVSREGQLTQSWLASDINALADVVGKESAPGTSFKIQFLGPISLASRLHLQQGERALLDYGARRDLRDSFLAGVGHWLSLLGQAVPGEKLLVQINEPDLDAALQGTIPTSSGFRTLPSLPLQEVEETYHLLAQSLKTQVDKLVLAEQEPNLPAQLNQNFDGLSYRVDDVPTRFWEKIASDLEAGKSLFLGLADPRRRRPVAELARRFWQQWRDVGLNSSLLTQLTLTETADLNLLNPAAATGLLEDLTELAGAIAELAQDS